MLQRIALLACLFLKGKKSEVKFVKQVSDMNSQSVAKKVARVCV